MSKHKRIVILGGGFGGVYTFKNLVPLVKNVADITLINDTNFFLFTPMLHEVATGGLGTHHITQPLRTITSNEKAKLIIGKVTKINLSERKVFVDSQVIEYDYLVLALGANSNFFGIEGAESHCFPLKTLEDAAKLKNHFIDMFDTACTVNSAEVRKRLLSFVVVGGGATGVELAAEMSEFFYDTLCDLYPEIDKKEVHITLLDNGNRLLAQFPESMSNQAAKVLFEKNIEVKLNAQVVSVDKNKVTLKDGLVMPTATVVWTAGVKPYLPTFEENYPVCTKDRIHVNEYLQLENYSNVYALGDIACCVDKETGKPYPMLAQVATKQASVVAHNIYQNILEQNDNMQEFYFKEAGLLVSLGQWEASGIVKGMKVSGVFAWWLWRTVYLTKFISWPKRLKIALDWTINIFSNRDISKL
ncbi:MAG: NAD(P)/FAD-dependent oxidoreductase [Patescibacteria group bacterium]